MCVDGPFLIQGSRPIEKKRNSVTRIPDTVFCTSRVTLLDGLKFGAMSTGQFGVVYLEPEK